MTTLPGRSARRRLFQRFTCARLGHVRHIGKRRTDPRRSVLSLTTASQRPISDAQEIESLKSKAQREFELSGWMLNDKAALHREYKRVTRKAPGAATDRALIQTILQIEYPSAGTPQPRNKTRANPAGK